MFFKGEPLGKEAVLEDEVIFGLGTDSLPWAQNDNASRNDLGDTERMFLREAFGVDFESGRAGGFQCVWLFDGSLLPRNLAGCHMKLTSGRSYFNLVYNKSK